jgi:hypothetical protein
MRRKTVKAGSRALALGAAFAIASTATAALAFPGGRVGGGGLGSRFGSVSGGRYTGDRDEGGFGGRFEGASGGGLRQELESEGGLGGFLQGRRGGSGEGRFGQRREGSGGAQGGAQGRAGFGGAQGGAQGRGQGYGTTSGTESTPSSSARSSSRGSSRTSATSSTTSSADGGDGHSYDTRGGGTVDTSKTTSGNTTTRDVDYTGANGQTADHSGSLTKDDGDFSYSGSGSTSAGASSHTNASGTYADGRVTSMNTSMSGQNAAGETGSHDGHWNRDGDTVSYSGNSQTSTGRDSEAAGWATKTDDGWVAHGAAANNQGAAAGTVVKDGDDVYARSVSTNGTTVNRNYTNCVGGDCTRTTVTTTPPPYYPTVTQYAYYPASYAYYACPPGGMTVYAGAGAAVYGCSVTPMVTTTIPLAAIMAMASHKKGQAAGQPATAQVTSSPVVMFQVTSDTVVYATSYAPKGLYWEKAKDRSLWVPGAAQGTAEVKRDIELAREMIAPTANATVITYTMGSSLVYLTNQPPLAGIYSQRAGSLYAWMPGVAKPTTAERDGIATAVTAHEQGGSKAIAAQVQKSEQQARPQVAAGTGANP